MDKLNLTVNICAKSDVPNYSDHGITDIISIGSCEDCPDIRAFRDHNFVMHRFVFNDVANPSQVDGNIPPSSAIVKKMINIFTSIKNRYSCLPDQAVFHFPVSILFHCQMGISRSTAAAFIFFYCLGYSFQEAYTETLLARHIVNIQPNMLMIKYADEILKCDGAMFRYVAVASGRPFYEIGGMN